MSFRKTGDHPGNRPGPTIVIIGAGRSGTTMLRDALGRHPDVSVVPYEVNYLWRHGNTFLPHDFLVPETHLSPRARRYISRRLERVRQDQGGGRLLDKTVANVVRPRYVQAVLPDARFVHVIRDGRAVAASAMKRWQATHPPTYYASKARLVPLGDLPFLGWRFLRDGLRARWGGRGHRQTWGVRFRGIDEMVATESLVRVCAAQWRHSVEAALEQAPALSAGSYMEVRYESVLASPVESFGEMQEFLELDPSAEVERWVRDSTDPGRRDRWRSEVSARDVDEIMQEAGPLLKRLGYE